MNPDREVAKTDGQPVAKYEPGVPLESIARGVIRRFLPGAALIYGPLFALGAVFEPSLRSLLVPGVVGLVGGLALGFGLGLTLLRSRLYPDAAVDGRRALVAGLLSPFAVMATSALGLPLISGLSDGGVVAVLAGGVLLVGFLLAVGLFFPWLTPTPEELRRYGDELPEGDEASALPGGPPNRELL